MRNLDLQTQGALREELLTYVMCVKATRRDGEVLRLTEHNEPLTFNGEEYEPGGTPASLSQDLGLESDAIDFETVTGQYSDDLQAKRFAGAKIEVWWVDWRHDGSPILLMAGTLGQLQRDQTQVGLQVSSLSEAMQKPQGRFYNRGCDAQFGDHRCNVPNFATDWQVPAEVVAVNGKIITLRSDNTRAQTLFTETGRFTHGWIEVTSGPNSGIRNEIIGHTTDRVQILYNFPLTLSPNDTVQLTAGCRKNPEACQGYRNYINFRGFPDIPGDEFIGEEANDPCNENTNRTITSRDYEQEREENGPGYGPGSHSGLPEPDLREGHDRTYVHGRMPPRTVDELQEGLFDDRVRPPDGEAFDRTYVVGREPPRTVDEIDRALTPGESPGDDPFADFSRQPARSPTDFQYSPPSDGGGGGGGGDK